MAKRPAPATTLRFITLSLQLHPLAPTVFLILLTSSAIEQHVRYKYIAFVKLKKRHPMAMSIVNGSLNRFRHSELYLNNTVAGNAQGVATTRGQGSSSRSGEIA